jgi:hypothetical protein
MAGGDEQGLLMPGMRGAGPVVALLAAMVLAACTASEVKPNLTMSQENAPAGDSKTSLSREAAAQLCAEKTRNKGIKSVTAIFSRLRPGKADEEFAACMREQGFAAGGVSEAGEVSAAGGAATAPVEVTE